MPRLRKPPSRTSSSATVDAPPHRRHVAATLAAVLALSLSLAACGGAKGTKSGQEGQGAGGLAAQRTEATCARSMPRRTFIDLTDLSQQTESQLGDALRGMTRTVPRLRDLRRNPVARHMAADLAKARQLTASYLRLAGTDALDAAANRFEAMKRWYAQLVSDAALQHAPSCSVHALLD
jgi:hypothetical protein